MYLSKVINLDVKFALFVRHRLGIVLKFSSRTIIGLVIVSGEDIDPDTVLDYVYAPVPYLIAILRLIITSRYSYARRVSCMQACAATRYRQIVPDGKGYLSTSVIINKSEICDFWFNCIMHACSALHAAAAA